MSRQSCLSLCHNRVNPLWQQKVPRYGIFPCPDIALYVATVGQGTTSEPGCMRATKTLCRNSVVDPAFLAINAFPT